MGGEWGNDYNCRIKAARDYPRGIHKQRIEDREKKQKPCLLPIWMQGQVEFPIVPNQKYLKIHVYDFYKYSCLMSSNFYLFCENKIWYNEIMAAQIITNLTFKG